MTLDECIAYANKCSFLADEGEESDAYVWVLDLARQSASVKEAKAILRRELERCDLLALRRHVYTLAVQREEPVIQFGHELDDMPRGRHGKRR
jgi:hypothetical protein